MQEQPILSICIPTYNRSKYLEKSLSSISQQMNDEIASDVEILVSDNCSVDDTQDLVNGYISKGLRLQYIRNHENIGADKNFYQCMKMANGKYVFLLGDDDILKPNAISMLVKTLKLKDWGCLHISASQSLYEIDSYNDNESFLKRVSYMITFMSSMIFRKDSVILVRNHEDYYGSCLLQVPFYIESALLTKDNVVICGQLLDYGLAANTNGGYNVFKVFIVNYLKIWDRFLNKGMINASTYNYLKKHIYVSYIKHYVLWLLFNREMIKKADKESSGYYIDEAWRILFKYYGKKSYFYFSFLWCAYRSFRHRIGKLMKWLKRKESE